MVSEALQAERAAKRVAKAKLKATHAQKQRVKDLAQEGKVLFKNAEGTEEVLTFQEAGRRRAGTEAQHEQKVAKKEQVVALAQERKVLFPNADRSEEVISAQEAGRRWMVGREEAARGGAVRGGRASTDARRRLQEKRESERARMFPVVHEVGHGWQCLGCEDLKCLDDMTTFRFGSVSNWDVASWMWRHNVFQDRRCRACEDGEVFLHDMGDSALGVRCATCLYTKRGAMRGWFSNSKVGPVKALALVWSIVDGIPLRFARLGACPGTSKEVWARGAIHWGSPV